MANILQAFTFCFILLALTTGFWCGGEGRRVCQTPIEFASCEKDHPSSCTNICRSGLYFPPYFLIKSVCEGKLIFGHYVYNCKCIWECDSFPLPAHADAAAPAPAPAPITH